MAGITMRMMDLTGAIAPMALPSPPGKAYATPPESSDELERRLASFLHARGVPGASTLVFKDDRGIVMIRGKLPSPAAKRLCLECCRHVAGVLALIDQVEIGD